MIMAISPSVVVSIVTKIRILKQITTSNVKRCVNKSCIYSNKDKNFKANHNAIRPIVHRVWLYL